VHPPGPGKIVELPEVGGLHQRYERRAALAPTRAHPDESLANDRGPFNFEEVPAGDYQAQVTWHSERAQCFDESTRQMRKLPSVWRGLVRSNQVTLHLP
jgi:hypothetical protein